MMSRKYHMMTMIVTAIIKIALTVVLSNKLSGWLAEHGK